MDLSSATRRACSDEGYGKTIYLCIGMAGIFEGRKIAIAKCPEVINCTYGIIDKVNLKGDATTQGRICHCKGYVGIG